MSVPVALNIALVAVALCLTLTACSGGGGDTAATKQGKCSADVDIYMTLAGTRGGGNVAINSGDDSLKDCASQAEWLDAAKSTNYGITPEKALQILCEGESSRVCSGTVATTSIAVPPTTTPSTLSVDPKCQTALFLAVGELNMPSPLFTMRDSLNSCADRGQWLDAAMNPTASGLVVTSAPTWPPGQSPEQVLDAECTKVHNDSAACQP
jgi:hypothetical protein